MLQPMKSKSVTEIKFHFGSSGCYIDFDKEMCRIRMQVFYKLDFPHRPNIMGQYRFIKMTKGAQNKTTTIVAIRLNNKFSRIVSTGKNNVLDNINSTILFNGSCTHIITRLFLPIQQKTPHNRFVLVKRFAIYNTNRLPIMAKP